MVLHVNSFWKKIPSWHHKTALPGGRVISTINIRLNLLFILEVFFGDSFCALIQFITARLSSKLLRNH